MMLISAFSSATCSNNSLPTPVGGDSVTEIYGQLVLAQLACVGSTAGSR